MFNVQWVSQLWYGFFDSVLDSDDFFEGKVEVRTLKKEPSSEMHP